MMEPAAGVLPKAANAKSESPCERVEADAPSFAAQGALPMPEGRVADFRVVVFDAFV